MPGITVASATATSVRRGSREPREIAPLRTPQQLAGCILWLPRYEQLRNRRDGDDSDLEEDRCYHPVVVLSPRLEDGKVVYLMMTSFGGRNLETHFMNRPDVRRAHLPIRPCDPHPDNNILLGLEDPELQLRKRSYVKTNNLHRIRLNLLEAYDRRGPDYILNKRSYKILIEHAKYTTPAPHPASNTVSSPGRFQQANTSLPITRERRGSYGEYVSALRGLESQTSATRAQYANPVSSPTSARYTRTVIPTERDTLLPSHGYSRSSYVPYSGSYPNSPGAYPVYGYGSPIRTGYRGPEPPKRFDWATFWKRLGKFLLVVIAFGGAYATYRLLGWMIDVARGAGSLMKVTAVGVSSKISGIWSTLAGLPDQKAQLAKRIPPRVLKSLGISV